MRLVESFRRCWRDDCLIGLGLVPPPIALSAGEGVRGWVGAGEARGSESWRERLRLLARDD